MYGTFTPMNEKSIDALNIIHKLPRELWIEIINYYRIDFKLACINKQFYEVFSVILLETIQHKFYFTPYPYYHNNANGHRDNFHKLHHYTSILVSYKEYNPALQHKIDIMINNHLHAIDILKNVKNLVINNNIDEQQFMFLSNVYHYPYQSILEWKIKGYCCLGAYLPFFIACCPIWCPGNCYRCLCHICDEDDTDVYKSFQPFSVLDVNKKRYYNPCDFSKYFTGNCLTFDEPKAFNNY